jgi:2-polyprenyl-3-methyl-5-hydroxy-6-metoxy-1,4-benzoquinol methylase
MQISGYRYANASANPSHSYLLPCVRKVLKASIESGLAKRVFEVGCGNGAIAEILHREGFEIVGVDPSLMGIEHARKAYPHLRLEIGSTDDDLVTRFGTFPLVLSLEVIEHVPSPGQFARRLYDLLEPGGMVVISTPYHGYAKNVALAITGRMDAHFTALWDHGHIKFWSVKTLTQLLTETGFKQISFRRLGRLPILAKSMIASARK